MLQFTFLTLFLCSQYAAGTPVSTSVYSQVEDIWLRLHIVPATWTVAAVQCQLEGGVLATPTTSALAESMRAAIAENKLSSVYIGVTESFSKGDYKSLDGVPFADIPLEWAAGEPNNANKSEHCLALTGAGALADVSCSIGLPYFCRKVLITHVANSTTVEPPCKDKQGYLWESRTGSCYNFHRAAKAWLPAFRTCHAEGGHLAIINNQIEATVLKEIRDKNINGVTGETNLYSTTIGVKKWHNKEWMTIHGETLAEAGFGKWSPGEPNNHAGREHCAAIFYEDGLLNDVECDHKYSYICEITP